MARKQKDNKQEELADLLDRKYFLEKMADEVLPEIQKLVATGASADSIYKKFSALAAARTITIALSDPDTGKAMSAIKEVMDRAQGKAVERKKLEHTLNDISDKELDALLKSEEAELSKLEADEEFDAH